MDDALASNDRDEILAAKNVLAALNPARLPSLAKRELLPTAGRSDSGPPFSLAECQTALPDSERRDFSPGVAAASAFARIRIAGGIEAS